MAFEQVGVRAVVKDVGQFARDIRIVQNNIVNIREVAQGAAKTASAAGIGIGSMAAAMTIAQTASNALSGAFNTLNQALKNVIGTAFEGARAFQRLEIRFQGLVANELIAAGRAEDFSTAMQEAGNSAEELLNWVQRLAIATPFTRQDISQTIAFSMAMGFTSAQAKELTLSIGNFVSGMGLGTEVMERIILQFGQMQAGGRLFGTELRDLARGALVPVNDLLEMVAESTGKSAREWQELAARGEVDIQPFFDAFINMAEKRFPDAMDRMNKTLDSVIQNVKEFFTEFIGVKALVPALNTVSTAVSKAFEGLVSPDVLEAFRQLGLRIDGVTKRLVSLGGQLAQAVFGTTDLSKIAINLAAAFSLAAEAITSFLDGSGQDLVNFVSGLADFAADAFVWGFNLVGQFAAGMIAAASNALVIAINFIGNVLTSWLAPGSPPAIAPDLPIWGAAALTEWLKGFSMADFSVVKSIQAPLRGALDALRMAGDIGRNLVGPIFADISTKLIEGLAGGGVGEDVFKAIRENLGDFGEEINELIRREIALKDAVQEVEEAEQALTEARERQNQATLKTRRLTNEYNQLLRSGAGKDVLRDKLAELNAAEVQEQVAKENLAIAAEDVKEKKAALDPIQEAVKLQEELLRQLIAIAKAQNDIREESQRGGGGGGAVGLDPEKILQDLESIGGGLSRFRGEFEQAFFDARARIKEALLTAFDPVIQKWKTEVKPALDGLSDAFENFIQNILPPVSKKIKTEVVPALEKLIKTIFAGQDPTKTFQENLTDLMDAFIEFVDTIVPGTLKENLDELYLAVVDWHLDTREEIDKAIRELPDKIKTLMGKIADQWERGWNKTKERFETIFETIKTAVSTGFDDIFTAVVDKIYELADLFKAGGILFDALVGAGRSIVDGLIQGVQEKAEDFIRALMGLAAEALRRIKELFGIDSPSKVFMGIGENLMLGLQQGIKNLSELPAMETQIAAQRTASAAVDGMPVMGTQNNVNFGGVTINDGMDFAFFESRIDQVLANRL